MDLVGAIVELISVIALAYAINNLLKSELGGKVCVPRGTVPSHDIQWALMGALKSSSDVSDHHLNVDTSHG